MAISAMGKKTWWNQLRVDRNIRYADLLELFPSFKHTSSIGAWFAGEKVPLDKYITILCDFFDVEFEEGKRHFIEDNKKWVSGHHRDTKVTTGRSEGISKDTSGTGLAIAHDTIMEEAQEERGDVFGMVYGKLPYDLFRRFCELVAGNDDNALALVYGKVSFEEFIFIQSIIKEE